MPVTRMAVADDAVILTQSYRFDRFLALSLIFADADRFDTSHGMLASDLRHGKILVRVPFAGDRVALRFCSNDSPQRFCQLISVSGPQIRHKVGFLVRRKTPLGLSGRGDPDTVAFAAEMAGDCGDNADAPSCAGD